MKRGGNEALTRGKDIEKGTCEVLVQAVDDDRSQFRIENRFTTVLPACGGGLDMVC
jgi:hypothetical protein